MIYNRLSLRSRIFFYMILLVVVASILIAAVTIYQYREQSKDYHKQRLERKESQVVASVENVLDRTTYEVKTANLPLIFKDEIYAISAIQKVDFNIYDLQGNLMKSSETSLQPDAVDLALDSAILKALSDSTEKRYVMRENMEEGRYRSSFIYLTDPKSKPLGILNIRYQEDDSFSEMELREFLGRLGIAYLIMFMVAIAFAYFVSKYITRSLQQIGDKLDQTRLNQRNEKIILGKASEEIGSLVEAYNSMVDELEKSAAKLAKSEREQAWREMAKQVAHEIKNPLTPMRLSVQSFQRKFDPLDPEVHQKVDEYSKTLIQQIDTMSNIASAFSNFAEMPAQQDEELDVVEVTKLALDIFNEDYIDFSSEKAEVIASFDRTQLIRVITNLVKNAIQSIPADKKPKIEVKVVENNGTVSISVADNGVGITEENMAKIYEPKFTTKSSGMGLGLGMVKNIVETYSGSINFTSQENEGTTFIVSFPKK
ncbi:ATP-binding protein [Sungkyunkwania multivorans]|uniref:histidine kinase n=1 Tax=Sungkyunkwania multivorans TaxID=1173618 RepID=A0ABW3CZQ2_9FLAO